MPDDTHASCHCFAVSEPFAPVYQSPEEPGVCTKPTDTRRHCGSDCPAACERATHSAFALFTASSMALLDSVPPRFFTPADCMAAIALSRVGVP